MIKLLIILLVGIGLGYTYGYMHGAAGEESVITSTLDRVGVHGRHGESGRRARADSVQQAGVIRPST